MSSTTYFSWPQPVAVTADTLSAFEDRLQRYGVLARRRMVSEEGANPDEIQTVDDAQRQLEATKEWRFERIAREIPKLESAAWSVHLANGIRRSSLSLDEVLKLSNAGEATIVEMEGVVGTYNCKLEITLSSSRGRSATITISGDYNDVHSYRDDISQLLSGATRNWSIVTRPWVGFLVTMAGVCAALAILGLVVLQIGLSRSWSAETGANWLMAVIGFVTLAWMTAGSKLVAKWQAIFPLVEFQIGGGINAAEARRVWRKVMWSVPVLVLGVPLFINWLSAALTK